jgi:hypothetical protein
MRLAMVLVGLVAGLICFELFSARHHLPTRVQATQPQPVRARQRSPLPKPQQSAPVELLRQVEEPPLPRTIADFPQTEEVKRGWASLRSRASGWGEGYWLDYLNILADLQECTRGRIRTRGKLHLIAESKLVNHDGHRWTKTIESIAPQESELTGEEDQIVLDCLKGTIGHTIELEDNISGLGEFDEHWLLAFPLRGSRIYQRILDGGR